MHFSHRPLVADTILSHKHTERGKKKKKKSTHRARRDDFRRRYCFMTGGRDAAPEVMLGETDSVSQPGRWRSSSTLAPGDAQSSSRIFFNYLSPWRIALSLMTEARFYAWLQSHIVRHSEQTRRSGWIDFFPPFSSPLHGRARCSPPRLFVFVGPAPTAGACLRPLRYCLSVCLSVGVPVCYN